MFGDSVKIPKTLPLDNDSTQAFDDLWDLDPYQDDVEVAPIALDADLLMRLVNRSIFS